MEKEVTTQECADVVKPPVCETVLGEDCYFVTKNTCSQDSEPLPGYESDTLPGNIKDLNFILFLKFVKFGLFEKHTEFENICLMVLMFAK